MLPAFFAVPPTSYVRVASSSAANGLVSDELEVFHHVAVPSNLVARPPFGLRACAYPGCSVIYWYGGCTSRETNESSGMTRKSMDCREYPSDMNCTVNISADEDEELLDASVQHAVSLHGHDDTPELREQLRGMMAESKA